MNRAQRRKLGHRGPLVPRAEREKPEAPVANHLSTHGMRWYSWGYAAHLFPRRCVAAFMERPNWWGTYPMFSVTKAQIKRRAIKACVECIQTFVTDRNDARLHQEYRAGRLADRAQRRALRAEVAAQPAG